MGKRGRNYQRKLDLLIHYKAEIEEFLKKYPYKAFVRTAIEKPFVKVEERGVDYVKVLYLPCWEKGENDEGEGLIPKKITQKSADFLLKRAFGGSAFKAFQAGIAENMERLPMNTQRSPGKFSSLITTSQP